MADYSSEQEQLEAIKNWWRENGTQILVAILVLAGGYAGWTGWQNHKQTVRYEANDTYVELAQAIQTSAEGGISTEDELSSVRFYADKLADDYASTGYSFLGALGASRVAVDAENYEEAIARYQAALDTVKNESDRGILKYRLAIAQFANGQPQEALSQLNAPSGAYQLLYFDLAGDIYRALGDTSAAAEKYQQAMDSADEESSFYVAQIEEKISTLVGAEPTSEESL